MRVLITGAAGFIGYHLSKRLLRDGHHVTGFDGMTSYYDVALKRARVADLADAGDFRLVTGLLEDRHALEAAAADAEPDVILHLAAQAGVRYSIEAPETYVASNLVGSFNVLELARALRPAHLLMASTSSIYGANPDVPFEERHRADEPLSLYAATKKGVEAMAHSYAHLFDTPTTMFRFFTVYGPWGRPDMALFKFTDAILAGRPIDVYGHGQMARDFTYIDDLVEAVVRLIDAVPDERGRVTAAGITDSLSRQAPYRVVNIAGGEPTPLLEFIRTIEHATGREAVLNAMEMQPGDVPQTWADPGLIKALTGYVPDTPVDVGVKRFVDWYEAYRSA